MRISYNIYPMYKYLQGTIIFYLLTISVSAQDIKIKVNIEDIEFAPKYIYWIFSGDFQRLEVQNQELIFKSNVKLTKDNLLFSKLCLTDIKLNNISDYTTNIINKKIDYEKAIFEFLIDTVQIVINLSYRDHLMSIKATDYNTQLLEKQKIYKEYIEQNLDSRITVNELNDWRIKSEIKLIKKYPSSTLSYYMLKSLISSPRSYANYLEIRDGINMLDTNVIKGDKISSLHIILDDLVQKNTPKKNLKFPNINFLTPQSKSISWQEIISGSQFIVVDFWATWCSPCKKQQPLFEEISKQYNKNANVKFIAISIDKNIKSWLSFKKKQSFPYSSFILDYNKHPEFIDQLGISSIPRYMIIDGSNNKVIAPSVEINKLKLELDKILN